MTKTLESLSSVWTRKATHDTNFSSKTKAPRVPQRLRELEVAIACFRSLGCESEDDMMHAAPEFAVSVPEWYGVCAALGIEYKVFDLDAIFNGGVS